VIPDRTQFRDSTRYLAAVGSEIIAPALRAYARLHARAPATEPRAWRRGGIVGSGHIGDVLYRTCSLDALARGLPECRWSYVTTRDGAELLRGNPALSEILPFNRETAVDFADPYSAADIRARNFDVILCTDNIEHHRELLMAAKLGVPNRVAFASKGFSGLATLPVATPRVSWPAQFRRMVSAVTGTVDTSPLRPRLFLDTEDRDAAEREWDALGQAEASVTIAAAITTRQSLGVLPDSFFTELLADVLRAAPDVRLVLAGSSADALRLSAIAAILGDRAIVRAGTLDLRAFAAFLEICDAFIGMDSGPRHLANAAGIPVYFVRNLGVPEIEAGRYCDTETDIAPAGQYLSPSEAMRRLGSIDRRAIASDLVAAARASRAARPRTPEAR
jgi:ADP-heptose:LPS heptosyltransferase